MPASDRPGFVAGLLFVKRGNYTPFVPPAEPASGGSGADATLLEAVFGQAPANFGISGIFAAGALVFFAFIGFDIVATAAEETRVPQRDVPRGILGSLAICTTLYVAVSLVVVGMQNYAELDEGTTGCGVPGRRPAVHRQPDHGRRAGRADHGGHDPDARAEPGRVRHEP
ncbi:APC family permease [Micromonospora globispora]|uniref:APC family permease n=1 Tax=Micromonospora globispora TaxID=1450148 RepID=UPI0021AB5DA9|nr:amino acid permease [Micromonospora globispora]